MAIFKTCNGGHKYFDSDARRIVINYELRPDKAIHKLYGGNVPDLIELLYYYILHNSSPIIFYIICNVFAISYEISMNS